MKTKYSNDNITYRHTQKHCLDKNIFKTTDNGSKNIKCRHIINTKRQQKCKLFK